MAKGRILGGLAAGLLLLGTANYAAAQSAPPSVTDMLNFCKPRQSNVVYSTPTPEEQKTCTVKPATGAAGWVLLDGRNRPLRRYVASGRDGKIDTWSYYKDGVEVYRDLDTNKDNKPDQSRWLNTAGTKWGMDFNQDGKIDAWRLISAEEAAQEVFLAVQTHDFARLKALFLTDAEASALKLPQADLNRIRDAQAKAEQKFNDTIRKVPQLTATASFVRVESAPPTCTPMDAYNTVQDIIRYTGRSILYEGADKKHDWIQTGPMILIGYSWKLLDAPVPGDLVIDPTNTGGVMEKGDDLDLKGNPALAALVKKLSELDTVSMPPTQGKSPAVVKRMLERAQVVEQILSQSLKPAPREVFIKQLSDNLSSAAQAGDANALQRLESLRAQLSSAQPSSLLTGYVTYRRLWAEFAPKIGPDANQADLAKNQQLWLENLSKFVQNFPKAEDTPEALMHLAMGSEFAGKEDEAKRYYQQLVVNFPTHPAVEKARGAVRRLDVVGQPLQLAGTTNTGAAFDISKLAGKAVVVYYWASYCDNVCVGEFARLKQLQAKYGARGFEVVAVNLDDRKEDAEKFLAANPLPATQLFPSGQPTGLNNPLATHYGITGLPMLFLVGKDGRVLSRTLQIGNLEDALQKAL